MKLEYTASLVEGCPQLIEPQTYPEWREDIRLEDHPDIQAAWQRAVGDHGEDELQNYWDKVNNGMSAEKIWTDCPVCHYSGRHTLTGMIGRKVLVYKCKNHRCGSKFSYEPETGRYNKIHEGEDSMSDILHNVRQDSYTEAFAARQEMQERLDKACEELQELKEGRNEMDETKQDCKPGAIRTLTEEPQVFFGLANLENNLPKGVEYQREGDMVRVGPATWDIGDNLRSVLIGGFWVVMMGAVLTMGFYFLREQSHAQQRRWEAEYYQNHGDARGYTEIPRGVIPVGKDR